MSNFKIKEKIDYYLYFIFNIASEFIFILNFRIKAILKKNKKFENLHSEQRCFIMGTGPSLLNISSQYVELLSNEIIMGVNSLYKTDIFDKINPTYYALIDNIYWGVYSSAFKEILSKYSEKPPTFITDVRAHGFVSDQQDSVFLYAKNYPINLMRYDLTGNVSITMNVVGFSILTAIYMGFKEVYLLGCDYNSFCYCGNIHCYDDESEVEELPKYNLSFYLKYYHLTTEFHYMLKKLADKKGVKIINLTQESLLDAYPKKSIESVFQ